MAVRYVEIGQYPDVRREVRGNLSEILAATANPGTYAAPEDVTGTFLEMGADGLWTGASVGTLTQGQADALVASGALASVEVGTPGNVAGTLVRYGGAGVGWGPANPEPPYAPICIGDSITEAFYAFSDLAFQRLGFGPGTKYAYPGKTAGEIMALIPAGLSGHIAIMAGTNDLLGAVPLATFAVNYEALCLKASASGRSKITCIGIPPNDTAGVAAGLHNAYNIAIWLIAKRNGFKYANPWKAITTLPGRCVSGTMNDATHPKDSSHFLVCPTLASSMQTTISDPPLKFSNGGGLVANPVFIDSNADGLADSLAVVTANAGVTPTVAAGLYGNKQIFTCNIASGIYQVRQYGIAAAAGDMLLIIAKLKTSSMSNLRANLIVKSYNGGSNNGGVYPYYRYQFDGEFVEILPFALPGGTTSFSINIEFDAATYPAVGTVEVECFEVYNLTAMGIADFA